MVLSYFSVDDFRLGQWSGTYTVPGLNWFIYFFLLPYVHTFIPPGMDTKESHVIGLFSLILGMALNCLNPVIYLPHYGANDLGG